MFVQIVPGTPGTDLYEFVRIGRFNTRYGKTLVDKRFWPDLEDQMVMQEMYSAIRGMYRHSSPEQKQLLATHPSQVL